MYTFDSVGSLQECDYQKVNKCEIKLGESKINRFH